MTCTSLNHNTLNRRSHSNIETALTSCILLGVPTAGYPRIIIGIHPRRGRAFGYSPSVIPLRSIPSGAAASIPHVSILIPILNLLLILIKKTEANASVSVCVFKLNIIQLQAFPQPQALQQQVLQQQPQAQLFSSHRLSHDHDAFSSSLRLQPLSRCKHR